MARGGSGWSPGRRFFGFVLASMAVLASSPAAAAVTAAHAAGTNFTIATRPALQPPFDPAIPDYVTRCEPAEKVSVAISNSSGVPVSVDRQPAETRSFRTTLQIGRGQSFVVAGGTGANRAAYTVRCLPADFPQYSAQVFAQPQAAFYLVTPGTAVAKAPGAPYVILFDSHGVPVWWYEDPSGTPVNANLMPNGDLSWYVYKNLFNRTNPPALTWQIAQGFGLPAGVSTGLGVPSGIDLVEHRLDGTIVRTIDAVGAPTDFHEGLPLSNGDFLMTSYVPRGGADFSPIFATPGTALDASLQEIAPNGSIVHSIDAAGLTQPVESARWRSALTFGYPGVVGSLWDYQHIDSVAPDADGYLISLAHTDAVYLIRASDGSVEWKLGGTPTSQSLRIIGDPYAASDFGGQSDARVWPDGTVSVYDDGINRKRPPRVLRFSIDTQARTATVIQTLSYPAVASSACCGSARLLPGGDWVVAWGATPIVNELTSYGVPTLQITFAAPYYTYRAVPILPGQLGLGALVKAMNIITPRFASGAHPPALTKLRALYRRVDRTVHVRFTLAWRAAVRFALARCTSATGCAQFVRVGATIARSAGRGDNRLDLGRRFLGGPLSPGLYRLVATPIALRQTGRTAATVFRVS